MTAKHYKQVFIRTVEDLPKENGLYWCEITESSRGSFHFNPENKDDIDFFLGNVMFYLLPVPDQSEIIEKLWKLITELRKLNNLCEAPQYHEIIRAKEHQKDFVNAIEQELAQLKNQRNEIRN